MFYLRQFSMKNTANERCLEMNYLEDYFHPSSSSKVSHLLGKKKHSTQHLFIGN